MTKKKRKQRKSLWLAELVPAPKGRLHSDNAQPVWYLLFVRLIENGLKKARLIIFNQSLLRNEMIKFLMFFINTFFLHFL